MALNIPQTHAGSKLKIVLRIQRSFQVLFRNIGKSHSFLDATCVTIPLLRMGGAQTSYGVLSVLKGRLFSS